MKVLNDLYDYGLKIYQDSDKFKFSMDTLLLTEFITIKNKNEKVLDLCTGNAPIPMILAKTYHVHVDAFEIQKYIYDLAEYSIKYNNLEDYIDIINDNATNALTYFKENTFDIITCNPPFFKKESGYKSSDESKSIARHELAITLEDIFSIASILLKDKGKFYLVHRPERIQEILNLATKYKLSLKDTKIITTKPDGCGIIMLMKFIKGGSLGTKLETKTVNRSTLTYHNIFNNK